MLHKFNHDILEVSDLNHWEDFLAPYKQAVEELKIKLKGMRSQFELENNHSPIEFVTGRVKPVASILDKANQKHIALDHLVEEMQDIAGLRMMCQFVDDIEVVVRLLRQRNDFRIVEERDYITNKKPVATGPITLLSNIQWKPFKEKRKF